MFLENLCRLCDNVNTAAACDCVCIGICNMPLCQLGKNLEKA